MMLKGDPILSDTSKRHLAGAFQNWTGLAKADYETRTICGLAMKQLGFPGHSMLPKKLFKIRQVFKTIKMRVLENKKNTTPENLMVQITGRIGALMRNEEFASLREDIDKSLTEIGRHVRAHFNDAE